MSEARARVRAPAKVNLSLRVLGPRPDGYHEVATTLLALDLADELELERVQGRGGVRLEVDGPAAVTCDVPLDESNLAWRGAASVLRAAAVTDFDVELRLRKALPAAAGLGGGSSDAAAAALGTAALIGARAKRLDLRALLAELGSDVPFFHQARGGLARCLGRGERVLPLAGVPKWAILLVTPAVRAPTAAVYAAWRRSDARADATAEPERWDALSIDDARASLCNELEPAALRAVEGLREWRWRLDRLGLEHARLAGSGSSFFALFEQRDAARDAAERVRADARQAGEEPRLVATTVAAGAGAKLRD